MTVQSEALQKRIEVSNKRRKADLVIKNGSVIDVFNQDIMNEDIAIVDGVIAGIGEFDGHQVLDAKGKYISPGFIDGHVHIESSMVKPSEFAKVVLPHGVTSVVTDPHEIANVAGEEGIKFMIEDSKNSSLDVHFMIPSSVPATPMEQNGAHLHAQEIAPFYDQKEVIGLAEVMDYPSVANASSDMLDKLQKASSSGVNIDGHGAGFGPDALNVYKSAGIHTDHECNTGEEALERVKRGMHVLIREGSASKDLTSIIPFVHHRNAHRFLFCTDDKGLDELIEKGSINENVRMSIKCGMDPIQAVQLATLNAAECYGLHQKGAIAPGYDADLIFLDDLDTVRISDVLKSGEQVATNGEYVGKRFESMKPCSSILDSVKIPEIQKESLQIPMNPSHSANVIEVVPNCLITRKVEDVVNVEDECFLPSAERDQTKLVVIERHQCTGNWGLGIVKGLNIQEGAIASTVAHDSHNLVSAGSNDEDIVKAIRHLEHINGGLAVVKNGEILSSVPFEIAGLMSGQDAHTTYSHLIQLNHALAQIMKDKAAIHPFLTMSFLTLPVIPELKLTTKGLYDSENHKHISVIAR